MPPATVPAYLECLRFFQELEKKPGNPGWRISWRNIKHPVLNKQLWPEQLSIESVDDLVLLCNQSVGKGEAVDELLDGLLAARDQGAWQPSVDSEARRLALLPETLPQPWDELMYQPAYLQALDLLP